MNGAKPNVSGSTFKSLLPNLLKGFLMGAADIIPGVSGGTMALIVGIYSRLIDAINQVYGFILTLLKFKFADAKKSFLEIDWGLLIPLAVGIGSALFLLSHIINHLLTTYPVQCRGLFFGLIAASVAIPWTQAQKRGPAQIAIAIIACLAAFFSAGLPPQEVTDPSALHIFGAASIAICAMILPGVSGAFLLLVMGLYLPTTEALKSLDLAYIAIFGSGAVVGMGVFSKLLKWLLTEHHDTTMAALVGLMLGSLRALWPWQTEDRLLQWPAEGEPVLMVVLLAIGGLIAVLSLVIWENKQRRKATA